MFYEFYKSSKDLQKYVREHLSYAGYKNINITHAKIADIDSIYKDEAISLLVKKLIEEIREHRRINNCERTSRRRALGNNTRRKLVKPRWADEEKIKALYAKAKAFRDLGIDVHVDHIVPVHAKRDGKLVACGLHTHDNLKLTRAKKNMAKGCKLED